MFENGLEIRFACYDRFVVVLHFFKTHLNMSSTVVSDHNDHWKAHHICRNESVHGSWTIEFTQQQGRLVLILLLGL